MDVMSDIFTNEVVGPLTDAELRAAPVQISGTVTATPTGTQDVNVTNPSLAVTGPLTDAQLRASAVPVVVGVASSSTVAQVSLPASTNTTLLASNVNRKKAIIFCPKAAVFIKLGATASNTSFTYKTPGADTTLTIEGYTGIIDAFGPGTTINVTELI